MSVIHNIFFFIVAIGVLVTFHEFGHYWVARKVGVKVLKFSVGFGKALFSWRKKLKNGDEVEYIIAAIPLGGYVKMLDEREGEVSASLQNRAFNNQPLIKRSAIVIAGPLFNFMLAIFLYLLVFMQGGVVNRPILGELTQDSIVQKSGFKFKDEILSVGETAVNSWTSFRLEILNQGLDGGLLSIKVQDEHGNIKNRQLDLGDLHLLKKEGDVFEPLGFKSWQPKLAPKLGAVQEKSVAEQAGLKTGDVITKADGRFISNWMSLVKQIQQKPKQKMQLTVLRDGKELTVNIIPNSRKINQKEQGFIGVYPDFPDTLKQQLTRKITYTPIEAMAKSFSTTWDISSLTLRVLWKMVTGEANLANISGPITIATYAGITASIGWVSFFTFLAAISISLGVLNLLPIPMLDGGHLLYYLIELIKGSPVSEQTELRGQQIGIGFLVVLMSLAMFNDIQRLLH